MFTPRLNRDDQVVAAACLLFFVLVFGVLLAVAPPDAAQRAAADPLLRWLQEVAGTPGAILLPASIALAWLLAVRAPAEAWQKGIAMSLAGALAGVSMVLLLRFIAGDALPSFIPPEESAAPGIAQGVGAGVIEEAIFRLGTLPLLFLGLHRRLGARGAAVVACLLTGIAFALSHELDSGGALFDATHFITRVLIPGVVMSVIALLVHPAFIVAAHCAAHVPIALLFVAGSGGNPLLT